MTSPSAFVSGVAKVSWFLLIGEWTMNLPRAVNGVLIQTHSTGGYGTGFVYNEDEGQILMSGTTFADKLFGEGPEESNIGMGCFVIVADENRWEDWTTKALSNPQICMGGAVVVKHAGFGVTVVMGPKQQQQHGTSSVLQTVQYFGDIIEQTKSHPLPTNTVPVAGVAGEATFVYLALQSASGTVWNSDVPGENNLGALLKYLESYTLPYYPGPVLSDKSPGVPQLVKIDVSTGGREFETSFLTVGDQSAGAIVTALEYTKDELIVVGSTNGSGPAYGEYDDDEDWDGYITFIDPDSGIINDSLRIQSADGNDYIQDVCWNGGNDLFLVGTTDGIMQGIHAAGVFLIKMDLTNKSIVWKQQYFSGMDTVSGHKCVVGTSSETGEESVFVGGNTMHDLLVSDGEIRQTATQDVFVTKISSRGGEKLWTQQLNTSPRKGEGRLDEIVGLEVHRSGKVHVMINSMNVFEGTTDIFLLDMLPEDGKNDLLGFYAVDSSDFEAGELGDDDEIPIISGPITDNGGVHLTIIIGAIAVPILLGIIVFGPRFLSIRNIEYTTRQLSKVYDDQVSKGYDDQEETTITIEDREIV